MTAATASRQSSPDFDQHCNEVRLVGRLSEAVEERTLPSGAKLVTWRLIVRRAGESRSPVDTIDCHAWDGRIRRWAQSWEAGHLIEVSGALRRRFWRGPSGPVSRYDVEVTNAKRVST